MPDEEPLSVPPSVFEQSPIASAVLVLATLSVIVVGALFILQPQLFAAEVLDDFMDVGLGAELPHAEIDAYHEAAEALAATAADPTERKRAPALREKACRLLSARAKHRCAAST